MKSVCQYQLPFGKKRLAQFSYFWDESALSSSWDLQVYAHKSFATKSALDPFAKTPSSVSSTGSRSICEKPLQRLFFLPPPLLQSSIKIHKICQTGPWSLKSQVERKWRRA
ncbi:hypothetical protein MRB53_021063 [Persea americana]|uniref:Uncharacterized protein n=1 Tax=Persea americana TaxID=3435 RepID=A0ACC2L3K7_PERAE|nr:hypothetical protein MRB53_021063 [Persea americana]